MLHADVTHIGHKVTGLNWIHIVEMVLGVYNVKMMLFKVSTLPGCETVYVLCVGVYLFQCDEKISQHNKKIFQYDRKISQYNRKIPWCEEKISRYDGKNYLVMRKHQIFLYLLLFFHYGCTAVKKHVLGCPSQPCADKVKVEQSHLTLSDT